MRDLQSEQALGLDQAVERSISYLFTQQRVDGSWRDTISSSALATGVCAAALYFADKAGFAVPLQNAAHWLCQTQYTEGSWGDAVNDPGTLNATSFATASLQLIDPEASQTAIQHGLTFIEGQGGLDAVAAVKSCSLNVLCLTLLWMAGLCEWKRIPHIPLGIILLPYAIRHRVSFTLPAALSLGLWHAHAHPAGPVRRFIQRIAEPRALKFLASIQDEDGGMEESPLLVGLAAVYLIHAGVGKEIIQRCISYITKNQREDGSWACERDLEFSATTMILMGLDASNLSQDSRLLSTKEWIFRSQWTTPFPATGCPSGGWGWGLPTGWPNTDDTSNALSVLTQMGVPSDDDHIIKGRDWLLSMQNANGSWACFVRNGFVGTKLISLDEPCPAFTSHALIGLFTSSSCDVTHPAIQRALRYLERAQRADGSIHCLWYRDFVSGTAFTLEAYAVLGLSQHQVAQRCRNWLLQQQNDDGSWGSMRGVPGSVEETAWALLALLKSGQEVTDACIRRAADWLVKAQQLAGNWIPTALGFYFNSVHYSCDHIANGFALQALSCIQQKRRDLCVYDEN